MNKFIKKIFKKYNLNVENLDENKTKDLVLFFLKGYFEKKFLISAVDSFADFILYENFLNKNVSIEDLELSDILETMSELGYYQKNSPDDFEKSIKLLKKYIENN